MLKKQTTTYLTAVVICLLFFGCSEKKDKTQPKPTPAITKQTTPDKTQTTEPSTTLEEEVSGLAELIVVFSTSNDLMTKYPSFKLGLFDVIAHIRTPENLARVSLYNLQPISTTDYINTTAVELSHLEEGSHLYLGSFHVPEGKLEHIELHVVGDNSHITIDNTYPTLIDAFFTTYTPGDARLQARKYPAETLSAVSGDITLNTEQPTLIDVQIDMNLTATMDPVHLTEPARSYALFTPSMTITEESGAVNISINQTNFTSFSDTTVGIGKTDNIAFLSNYSMATDAKIIVNGSDATSLADTSGLYAMDISGTFTPSVSGHSITINHASLSAPSENSTASLYSGYVNTADNNFILNGTQQTLFLSKESLSGSAPFNDMISDINAADLGLSNGDLVTLWVDGTNAKLLKKHTPRTATSKLLFDLSATLSYPAADILSINTSTSTDTSLLLTLSEALTCADWVVNTASTDQPSCSGNLTSIEFTKNATGQYTLHETRRGTLTGESTEGKDDFSLSPDRVLHFDKMSDFLTALENRVKTDKYRLTSLTAEGSIDGEKFNAEGIVKATLLQPNKALDDESDTWFAGLEDEASDPLGADKSKKIALYAGLGIAGAVGVAAVAYLVKRILNNKGISVNPRAYLKPRSANSADGTIDDKALGGSSESDIVREVLDKNDEVVKVKQGPSGLVDTDGSELDSSKLHLGQTFSLKPIDGVTGIPSKNNPELLLYPMKSAVDLANDQAFSDFVAKDKLFMTTDKVKTEYGSKGGITLKIGDNVIEIDSLRLQKTNKTQLETIDLTHPKNGTIEIKNGTLSLLQTGIGKMGRLSWFTDLAVFNPEKGEFEPTKIVRDLDLRFGETSVFLDIEKELSAEHQRVTKSREIKASELAKIKETQKIRKAAESKAESKKAAAEAGDTGLVETKKMPTALPDWGDLFSADDRNTKMQDIKTEFDAIFLTKVQTLAEAEFEAFAQERARAQASTNPAQKKRPGK